MPEIYLNQPLIALIKKAIKDGTKSFRYYDDFVNIQDGKVTITSINTGQQAKILNWPEKKNKK